MGQLLFDFQLEILIDASAVGLHAQCESTALDLEALASRGILRAGPTGLYRLTVLGYALLRANILGCRFPRTQLATPPRSSTIDAQLPSQMQP